MKIRLTKGISIDGNLQKDINLDINKIKGKDCIEITENLAARGHTAIQVLEMDKMYHAAIAAKSLGVSLDEVLDLDIADFSLITMNVQAFFMGADSDPQTK